MCDGKMSSGDYEDIWDIVKKSVQISRQEFDELVEKIYSKARNFLTKRAAAMIVARNLGVDTSQIAYTPIVGRLLEVGPVKKSKSASGETPYVLFTVVNEEERIPCVAFGEHHVSLLRQSEDKVLMIRKYTKAKLRKYTLVKVTENSIIEILDDSKLPPITDLKPAWADSLKFMKENRGAWLVKVLVIDESTTEYFACPICGKSMELQDSEWVCPEHGDVEPEVEKVWRYVVSDRSGTFPAVYFKDPPEPSLLDRLVVLKGYFRDDELYISKIYWVSEKEAITFGE